MNLAARHHSGHRAVSRLLSPDRMEMTVTTRNGTRFSLTAPPRPAPGAGSRLLRSGPTMKGEPALKDRPLYIKE